MHAIFAWGTGVKHKSVNYNANNGNVSRIVPVPITKTNYTPFWWTPKANISARVVGWRIIWKRRTTANDEIIICVADPILFTFAKDVAMLVIAFTSNCTGAFTSERSITGSMSVEALMLKEAVISLLMTCLWMWLFPGYSTPFTNLRHRHILAACWICAQTVVMWVLWTILGFAAHSEIILEDDCAFTVQLWCLIKSVLCGLVCCWACFARHTIWSIEESEKEVMW